MLSLVVCTVMQACVHADCRLCGTLVTASCVWNVNECLLHCSNCMQLIWLVSRIWVRLDLSAWRELVVTLGNSGKYTKSYLPCISCTWTQVGQMLYCVLFMLFSTCIITMVIEQRRLPCGLLDRLGCLIWSLLRVHNSQDLEAGPSYWRMDEVAPGKAWSDSNRGTDGSGTKTKPDYMWGVLLC